MALNQIMPPLQLKNDHLLLGGMDVSEIAGIYGTPIYAIDEERIRSNCRRTKAAFEKNYKKFKLNYAVKSNNNLAVLNIVRQEGAGADCSCLEELTLASLARFDNDKLLYSGNNNSDFELSQGVQSGAAINLDDVAILPRLLKFGLPEILSFRVNPGIGQGQYPGLVFGGQDTKFGVEESHVLDAYSLAKQRGVKRFGMHMMTGSNVLNIEYFVSVTRKLFEIAESVSKKLGITFEFVDIGGGFGVPYKPDENTLDIERVGSQVGETFREYVERKIIGEPYLMIEPGRFIVCDSAVLLGRVHHIKHTANKTFVGTDIGMNTLLRPALYGAYHHIYNGNRPTSKPESTYTITGQVCENTDILAKDRQLPQIETGDVIVVMNAGAYGYSMSSQYNSRPRASEVLVHNGETEIIRERETVNDLIFRQHIPTRLLK